MKVSDFKPNALPTAVGSMPHTDPQEACSVVLEHLTAIPAWPQLPRRSFLENMYVQFSEGFPGVVREGDRIYVECSQDLSEPLEQFYAAYLKNAVDSFAIGPDYAAGLYTFLGTKMGKPIAVKGQVTGPVSWGLSVTDEDRRPMLYDDVLSDALAKHLRLKAAWQEKALATICPTTIIFVDEPYMSSFGSAFVSLSRSQVVSLLEEVFQGIKGLKGIHCCGNTDWSVLLETSLDILNFDAYNYSESLSLFPAEVKSFLDRGGIIAWGIVPNEEPALGEETAETLVARLEEAMAALSRKGIAFEQLIDRCLITPSCGLGSLPVEAATRALQLTAGVSAKLRKRYFLA